MENDIILYRGMIFGRKSGKVERIRDWWGFKMNKVVLVLALLVVAGTVFASVL
jgi:hypothetical protein